MRQVYGVAFPGDYQTAAIERLLQQLLIAYGGKDILTKTATCTSTIRKCEMAALKS